MSVLRTQTVAEWDSPSRNRLSQTPWRFFRQTNRPRSNEATKQPHMGVLAHWGSLALVTRRLHERIQLPPSSR